MNLMPGSEVFRLKDQQGVPLSMTVGLCLMRDVRIEWPSFIEAARSAGWYDFQTFAQLKAALTDADVGDEYTNAVVQRFKLYVLQNPRTENCS
jgi:alanyl-tRNA synthetase